MTSNFDQTQQWKLLETWYMDSNPHKSFDSFLRIRGFPNSPFETNGLYYLQICRKFWFASRADDQLEWVRKRMLENKEYEDEYGEPSNTYTHEAEPIYNQVRIYKMYKDKELETKNTNTAFNILLCVCTSSLLLTMYIYYRYV